MSDEPNVSKLRWKRDVPINLCLLYLSYLPLQFSVPQRERQYIEDPYGLDHAFDAPTGKYVDMDTLSDKFWFSMENWMSRKYHTLLLYTFSSHLRLPVLYYVIFTGHIVPSTGLLSFWFAYFMGSVGGGVGKVLEYYYSLYRVHEERKVRRDRFNIQQLSDKEQLRLLNDTESDTAIKCNPHDYIDDKLLDKLFYVTNAKEPYCGPEMAINSLIGYSFALSAHYLFIQIKQYIRRRNRIFDATDEHAEEIEDDEPEEEDIQSIWRKVKQYQNYKQLALTVYHCVIFGCSSCYISWSVYLYLMQITIKQKDAAGYGYMTAGRGVLGQSLGTVTSIASGIVAYPLVLNASKVWKWNKSVQIHRQSNSNNLANK